MEQLTVRGFGDDLAERIQRLAIREGKSLNQTVLKLLRKGAGLTARGKSHHGIRPSLHPGGRRCDSGTYSRYAPESRLVRRAQERSRCSRDFHHGLLREGPGDADTVGSSLDHLIGTWTRAEADEVDSALEEFEKIDGSVWE